MLEKAIQLGLNSMEYFAFASGLDGARCIDLKFNQSVGIIERSGYLVKVAYARKQIAEEEAKRQLEAAARAAASGTALPASAESSDPAACLYAARADGSDAVCGIHEAPAPSAPKNTRFFLSAQLDTIRIGRDVQRLVEEVISHLTSAEGTNVEVTLEVTAKSPDGMSQQVVRTVSENCRTLRVENFGFDE